MGTEAGGDCRIKFCTVPLSFMGTGMTGWFCGVISAIVTVISGGVVGVRMGACSVGAVNETGMGIIGVCCCGNASV